MIDASLNEADIVKDICEQSFYEFVVEFWDTIIEEDPIWNWHIEYICNELQVLAERVMKGLPKDHDTIINISPGSTKSTICSVMFPAWVWTRMPSARFICASYSHNLAMDLSRKCRDVIESDKYREIWPDICLRHDQNTKSYFANTKKGSRYAVGVGGSVMGMHGHFLMVDDPLNPAEAISEAELKTANRWMNETLPTRKVDKAIAVTVLIMQRLHQDDPTQNMLNKARPGRKIKHICLPAEISDETKKHVKPRKLVGRYVDGLMDPIRLSRKILDEALTELLAYGYAGQFLQWPVPLGGGMFKFARIKRDVLPERPRWKWIVRYWDKAGTQGGGAFTVGALIGEDSKGRIWVLDIKRVQLDTAEREALSLSTARNDTKKVLIGLEQEPGSGGKDSATNSAKNLRGFRVRIDRPTGDKALRAEPFSVQVNIGNVYIPVGVPWFDVYINEMQFFPMSKYKDQMDASSGAFNLGTKKRVHVGGLSAIKKNRGY